jgi:hypothetical protein
MFQQYHAQKLIAVQDLQGRKTVRRESFRYSWNQQKNKYPSNQAIKNKNFQNNNKVIIVVNNNNNDTNNYNYNNNK